MRVLGIDPGSRYTGYAIVERQGQRLVHVASGRWNLIQKSQVLSERLEALYLSLRTLIQTYHPVSAGIEGIFHHKNASSALTLGHARGVALLACQMETLAISEYPPKVVKKAIVGTGRADKHQVQEMVRFILNLTKTPLSLDQSDALAIAICHLQRQNPHFLKGLKISPINSK